MTACSAARRVHNPAEPTTNAGLVQKYEQEATAWLAEAANHRQMAIDYRRFSKSPLNPAIPKMEQHCNAIIDGAEARAAKAHSLATEYRLRNRHSRLEKLKCPAECTTCPAGITAAINTANAAVGTYFSVSDILHTVPMDPMVAVPAPAPART